MRPAREGLLQVAPDVALREADAVLCERIDVGSGDVFAKALSPEFPTAEVVGVEDHDVGPGRGDGRGGESAEGDEEEREAGRGL